MLALAHLKFDLMKKSEIRENLKNLHPCIQLLQEFHKLEGL